MGFEGQTMSYKTGTGKTGRRNPTDARYSLSCNPMKGVMLVEWAHAMLTDLARKAKQSNGEYVARLIEKAAEVAIPTVITLTIAAMIAESFDK
jgi:hypothetical protein